MHALFSIVIVFVLCDMALACAALYLLPVLIGWTRRVPDIGSVAVINVLLGWTLARLGRRAGDGTALLAPCPAGCAGRAALPAAPALARPAGPGRLGRTARTAAAPARHRAATHPAPARAGQHGHRQPPGAPVTSRDSSAPALSATAPAPGRRAAARPSLLAAGAVLAAGGGGARVPAPAPAGRVPGRRVAGHQHQRRPGMTSLTGSRPDAGSQAGSASAPRAQRARCRGRRAAGGRVRSGLRGRAAACRAPRAGPCSGLGAGPLWDGRSSPAAPKPPAPWLPGTGRWTPAQGGVSMTGSARLRPCPCLPGRRRAFSAPAAVIVWLVRTHDGSGPGCERPPCRPRRGRAARRISEGPGRRMRARSGCDAPARPRPAPAVRDRQAGSGGGLSGRAAVRAGPPRRLAAAPPPAPVVTAGRHSWPAGYPVRRSSRSWPARRG